MSTTLLPPSTSSITFRQLKSSDADFLHTYLNGDKYVMQFIYVIPSYLDTIREVERVIDGYASYPAYGRWIAELLETDEPVGWFALDIGGGLTAKVEEEERQVPYGNESENRISNDNGEEITLDIGYRLRRKFWGMGLATEGGRALIDYAFSNPSATGFEESGTQPLVRRIVGNCMYVNERSRRVMEKCEMRHARTVTIDFPDPLPGTEQGEALFEMEEWEWGRTAR